MIVAPELFTPERAMGALRIVDANLRGPLGMKTLDPSDSQYRPNYDNSNDGTDQAIAKGWNVSPLARIVSCHADEVSITKVQNGSSQRVGS